MSMKGVNLLNLASKTVTSERLYYESMFKVPLIFGEDLQRSTDTERSFLDDTVMVWDAIIVNSGIPLHATHGHDTGILLLTEVYNIRVDEEQEDSILWQVLDVRLHYFKMLPLECKPFQTVLGCVSLLQLYIQTDRKQMK